MSTETAHKESLISVGHIQAEDFLNILSEVYGTILLSYDLHNRKLLYNRGQLNTSLGYDSTHRTDDESFLDEIVHPDDRQTMHQVISMLDTQQETPYAEMRLLHNDGSYRRYKIRARQKLSKQYAILVLLSEHSAYAEADEINELKRSKAAVIAELQRSNKELEEFAYIASHDLQEPLRKISTFSGRLVEKFGTQFNDEGKLYLSRVMASAENMRILIDNLLDFSRISRIQQPFTTVNLNFILQQVKNELELTIEETSTKILSDDLPTIEASMSQMKQLFNNIVNNAIKFRKADLQPEISVQSYTLSSEEKHRHKLKCGKEYVGLRFCDNGIGFEPEYATRIFQIFQRLHGKSEYPGSGIGLAICKKITDHHNGIIFAENMPGKGACFTIILPKTQD